MAEDKTFRYGLIVLGFFLVMIGMFIMSVEKPQIYISFCTLGVLMIAVGIVWSMCQCYPKIRVVSVDAETEKFLIKKPIASSLGNEIPEKNSSQTPYTSQKEAEVYERSLPSYEQTQMKTGGSGKCLGVLSVPIPPPGAEGSTQPIVQAKADVHRDSENDGGTYNDSTCQREATGIYGQSERSCKEAPLASFQDEGDTSSVESASNSHLLQRWKDASQPVSPTESQLGFKLPSYEDFALIDSLMVEGQGWSHEKTLAQNESHCAVPATAGDAILATGRAKLLEHRAVQNVEDDEMYYGIKEGSGGNLKSRDAAFETKK